MLLADSRSSTERRPLSDRRSLPAGGKRQTLQTAIRPYNRRMRGAPNDFGVLLNGYSQSSYAPI